MRFARMGKVGPGLLVALAAGALSLSAPAGVSAQQLVFRPTNPAFGGNPLNQQWLLSTAEAQKGFAGAEANPFERDPILDFQQNLQRQILSALAREILTSRFGPEVDLLSPGRYDLGDFVIEILPGLAGVEISILNVATGGHTTITIPSF